MAEVTCIVLYCRSYRLRFLGETVRDWSPALKKRVFTVDGTVTGELPSGQRYNAKGESRWLLKACGLTLFRAILNGQGS